MNIEKLRKEIPFIIRRVCIGKRLPSPEEQHEIADQILSLDLYMEVEGEFPKCCMFDARPASQGDYECGHFKTLRKAGYKLVQPTKDLVKEVK